MALEACSYHYHLPPELCNRLHSSDGEPIKGMTIRLQSGKYSFKVTATDERIIVAVKEQLSSPTSNFMKGHEVKTSFIHGFVEQVSREEFKDSSSPQEGVSPSITIKNFTGLPHAEWIKQTQTITENILQCMGGFSFSK